MPVEIIAEVANAHQGDPAQAAALAEQALQAGADAVKFQIYFAEELLVRAHPRFEHFQKQAFAPQVWNDLLSRFVNAGARVYCDVFGVEALRVARANGVYGFKIHSSDLNNNPLLDALAETGSRVLVAVGGSTAREIGTAVRTLTASPTAPRPVLLHGFQSYPTLVEDTALERLNWLREIFGDRCEIGYMDHVSGDDPFAVMLPLMALAMGATVLEKHVTLNRAARGVDYYSSLEPDGFAQFVAAVRRAEQAMGADPEQFAPSEREYRRTVKKHWVAAKPLAQGHVLQPQDVVMKRVPDVEIQSVPLDELVGRPLLRAVAEEDVLMRADVPQVTWAMVVARMNSLRLPGKALLPVNGIPALAHLFERLKQAKTVDRIMFCTTHEAEDDVLVELAAQYGVDAFRGATDNVLERMIGALAGQQVDLALRVTGDDILVDPGYVDYAVAYHLKRNAEYSDLKALPSGTEVEVFDVNLLRTIWTGARDSSGTEYLTTYITAHADQFRIASVPVQERHARRWRLTLDTAEDYQVICALLDAMQARGKPLDYRLDDIADYFEEHPETLELNTKTQHRGTPPQVRTDLDWRVLT